MKCIKVKTPGTCGEYIQGWYKENPCLISSPMNRYSTIMIEEGRGQDNFLKPKMLKLLTHLFKSYGISENEKKHFRLKRETDISVGKGMASSTADLAGTATALSAYFELNLSPSEIGALCTAIEPSDNLMFPKLNLFNHISGEVLEDFDKVVVADLLMVDFYGNVNTMTFNERKEDYSLKELEIFEEIIEKFKEGLEKRNLKKIGEACTNSARLNQKRLYKPYLEKMIALTQDHQGLGTIIGHSGTVIGVMYEEKNFYKQEFIEAFKKEIPKETYENIYKQELIPGGISIINQK